MLLLALGLRVYRLDTSPPSLYWEEVALGYDAYSIYKTGMDHHSNPWPIVAFESFGDWKPALYFYLIIPFLPLFGLGAWAVRLPSALAGVVTVGLVYLIAKELKLRKPIPLVSALFLAIMPWHLQFSRAGFEVVVATMFLCLGVWLLLKGRRKYWSLFGGAMSLVLAMYAYHGLRVLAPLIGMALLLLFGRKWVKSVYFWLIGVVVVAILSPLLVSFNSPSVRHRFQETSLFSVSEAVIKTNAWREVEGNSLLARINHHRYWYWGKEVLSGMLKHFDINFLFIEGDENGRHQTGYYALLYYWMIIPLLWGGYELVKGRKRSHMLLVLWIVMATIPPAITKTIPHTLRFLPATPAIAVLVGIGFSRVWAYLSARKLMLNNLVKLLVIGVILIEGFSYLYDYHLMYPKRSSRVWQYGYEEMMIYVDGIRDNYDHVYITNAYGRSSMYAFFYWKVDPGEVQEYERSMGNEESEIFEFDNVLIENNEMVPNSLVVSNEPLVGVNLLNSFPFLDGKPAFYVYEI